MRVLALLAVPALVTAVGLLRGADGVVFYNRIPSLTAPIALGRVNADGSGIQAVGLNLPSTMNPVVSRDGLRMLVTSPDPGRPFKISPNVYVVDLLTGGVGRATSYQDEVVSVCRRAIGGKWVRTCGFHGAIKVSARRDTSR